jgi:hypothetical protein
VIPRLLGFASGLAVAIACTPVPSGPSGDCVDAGQCGDMQACIESRCTDVECLSSIDCGLEEYCNTEANAYTCASGCISDSDCPAGKACDTDANPCETYECRSTDLDCSWGEFCNPSSGECERASGDHCSTCDPYDFFGNGGCSDSASCFTFDYYATTGYCLEACQTEDDCPRGYECGDVTGLGDLYCFAWCPDL